MNEKLAERRQRPAAGRPELRGACPSAHRLDPCRLLGIRIYSTYIHVGYLASMSTLLAHIHLAFASASTLLEPLCVAPATELCRWHGRRGGACRCCRAAVCGGCGGSRRRGGSPPPPRSRLSHALPRYHLSRCRGATRGGNLKLEARAALPVTVAPADEGVAGTGEASLRFREHNLKPGILEQAERAQSGMAFALLGSEAISADWRLTMLQIPKAQNTI